MAIRLCWTIRLGPQGPHYTVYSNQTRLLTKQSRANRMWPTVSFWWWAKWFALRLDSRSTGLDERFVPKRERERVWMAAATTSLRIYRFNNQLHWEADNNLLLTTNDIMDRRLAKVSEFQIAKKRLEWLRCHSVGHTMEHLHKPVSSSVCTHWNWLLESNGWKALNY